MGSLFFNSVAAASHRNKVWDIINNAYTFKADVYGIPCYGQSLTTSHDTGPTTFSGAHPLAYDINLQNNNIQDLIAGTCEGFQIAAEAEGITIPENFKIVSHISGLSGADLSLLTKGSDKYTELLGVMQTTKDNCDTAGLTFNIPVMTFTHGESHMVEDQSRDSSQPDHFNPFTYAAQIEAFYADLNADFKAITGQTNDLLLIVHQVASQNVFSRYPRVGMQQDKVAKDNPNIVLGNTMYSIDYNEDQVHVPSKSTRYMGNKYGSMAIKALALSKSKHLTPISHTIVNNVITIQFDVPFPPLAFDTVLVNALADGNYGFNVITTTEGEGGFSIDEAPQTSITDVSITGDTEVTITLNQAPVSGERLTYGVNGDGWVDIDGNYIGTKSTGRTNGSRGNLRDSQPYKNNNSGAVYTDLYNWSVIFEIKIP